MGLTCCPNPTKRKLMSAHKVGGNQDSSVRRVNSGVASVGTHPSREHTLLTFVSTIKPSSPLHHNVDVPLNTLTTALIATYTKSFDCAMLNLFGACVH